MHRREHLLWLAPLFVMRRTEAYFKTKGGLRIAVGHPRLVDGIVGGVPRAKSVKSGEWAPTGQTRFSNPRLFVDSLWVKDPTGPQISVDSLAAFGLR
jgi:hypothetical protein